MCSLIAVVEVERSSYVPGSPVSMTCCVVDFASLTNNLVNSLCFCLNDHWYLF